MRLRLRGGGRGRTGGHLLLLHGGVGGAQTGASDGLEDSLHLGRGADEGLTPEAVLGVLDQLDEGDQQAPLKNILKKT